ncbi:MAG: PrsW family glutamic-type intramembrane protease [Candidatus Paceibacterota bacterium]
MALIFFISSFFGILPIVLWLVFFLWQDILKPEPLKCLLILFGLGILITPLIWYGEGLYLKLLGVDMNVSLSFLNIILVYGGIAIIEELAKFFSAYFILKRNKHFDEAIDAMIYLIVLALGFGLVENILAASQEIVEGGLLLPVLQTISLRFVGANLLHALSSGIIGFFWALFLLKKKKSQLYWGLVLGIALHFFFNLAIIKFGGTAVFLISLGLFFVAIGLLWAFDLLKKIKKPIKFI